MLLRDDAALLLRLHITSAVPLMRWMLVFSVHLRLFFSKISYPAYANIFFKPISDKRITPRWFDENFATSFQYIYNN